MRARGAIAVCVVLSLSFAVPAAAQGAGSCVNPNALGIARTVEIDTKGGPGFGLSQYKTHDFLMMKEIVLTFDDGPWPGTTRAVLEALARHCTKAIFFPIGKHATWHPEILKEVAAAGHTIGSHTWSHTNIAKLKGEKATEEIEKGFSAVKLALGTAPSPFFRFPFLKDPPDQLAYLGARNIAVFSHDLDSNDFKIHKPEDVINSVLTKLDKTGKGIILMHDRQHGTAAALPELLDQLKAAGYKVVHVRAKAPVETLAHWDEVARSAIKGASMGGGSPTASVVRTVSEPAAVAPALPTKSAQPTVLKR